MFSGLYDKFIGGAKLEKESSGVIFRVKVSFWFFVFVYGVNNILFSIYIYVFNLVGDFLDL